ncbi:hypothetical protein [Xenorhabdus bovienii]|uniref:Short-chain dehydrogenase/reductase SDR n=1 Tax=Xenorhabdus bovienii str. kraussei Becker Underwood TaxID=1398204 RepID=A0A077Q2C6_XENBV|nr:hypothetical protein [Xenorhabdus bovienii]CDH26174.1 hypothetical protein XBKB1_470006 [Xenorhabdus bovienii str. kraussei Becker Underwood]
MKHTILICGYGPGISHAVARRFGKAGHPVALAISVAAQYKTTRILTHTFASHDIHVSEVIVNGFVNSTPGEAGKNSTIAPADIAEQFWKLYTTRQTHSIIFGSTIPVSETVAHA